MLSKTSTFFLLLLFSGVFANFLLSVRSDDDDETVVINKDETVSKLPALGRSARIGSLYNAYTESFLGVSLFNKSLPARFISRTDSPSTSTKFGVVKSHSDKSSLLGISAALSLSILSGKVGVSGSGKYLHSEQRKSNSVVGSVLYETQTCEEVLEIFHDEIKEYISMPVLENVTATHLVIGVGYGANVVVKMEDSNEEGRDETEIGGKMRISLNIVGFGGISASASVDIGETDLSSFSSYSMQIFGDVALGNSDYPTNVIGVIGLIEKIPALVQASNDGKGRQQYFYLLPLQKLWNFVSHHDNAKSAPNPGPLPPPEPIPPEVVESQLQIFEQISIVNLKLNDLTSSVVNSRDVFNNTDIRRLKELRKRAVESSETYKMELKRTLSIQPTFDLKSGEWTKPAVSRSKVVQKVKEIEQRFRQSLGPKFGSADSSLEKVENIIDEQFQDLRTKVEMVEFLQSQGAVWVGREHFLDTGIIKVFKEVGLQVTLCSIHYYREYLQDTLVFIKPVLAAAAKNHTTIIVDCDFSHSTCESPVSREKNCIPLYYPPGH